VGISTKKSWLALVCATALHLLLLQIQISIETQPARERFEIDIRLVSEQPEDVTPEKEIVEQSMEQVEPLSRIRPKKNIIVAKPSTDDSKQAKVSVDVSINGDEFKKFLRNETDSFRNANPKTLESFNQTFGRPKRDDTKVSGQTNGARTQALKNGVGQSIDENGRHTCYALIPNITDPFGPPSSVSKDCTPPKKFILDLDKPVNN